MGLGFDSSKSFIAEGRFVLVFDFVTLGILLVIAGFAVVFLAILISGKSQPSETRVKGGGVIMVGPIPIIFGSDAKWASIAVILALVLVVFSLLIGLRAG